MEQSWNTDMVETPRDERVRYGLIGLLAVRRARAERERQAAEVARKTTAEPEKPAPRPRRRGWFG